MLNQRNVERMRMIEERIRNRKCGKINEERLQITLATWMYPENYITLENSPTNAIGNNNLFLEDQ